MAKILKISGYIIDHDDEGFDKNQIEDLFDNDKYLNINCLKVVESKEFEWHDDIDINIMDAKQEDFEKHLVNALNDMPNNGIVMPVNVEIENKDQSTIKILQNEIKDIIIKNSSDMIANEIIAQLKLKGFRFR
jgi:hypothetical protein